MNRITKNIIISVSVLLLCITAQAQNPVGTTAAEFLGIAVGPKAYAMGGAYVAMANDVTSAYWNPGALAFVENHYITISHSNWIIGTSFNWVGFSMNMGGGNILAINMTQLDYGEEEITTIYEQDGTNQFWSASNISANISYARKLTDRFSLGGTAKLIYERIHNVSATGIAADFGVLYVTGFNGMRLGMSISNYGTKMRLDGDDLFIKYDEDPENKGNNETLVAKKTTLSYSMPIFFRVGVAYDFNLGLNNRLTTAVDAAHPSNSTEYVNLGAEYSWNEIVFLRGGYKSLFQMDSKEGFTVGGGLQYHIQELGKIAIDYSNTTIKGLDNISTFAFSFVF